MQLHELDLEAFNWTQLAVSGTPPAPRYIPTKFCHGCGTSSFDSVPYNAGALLLLLLYVFSYSCEQINNNASSGRCTSMAVLLLLPAFL